MAESTPQKERRFRIRNVSGAQGVIRTIIPYGGSAALPPSTYRRRKPRRKPGRHTALITTSELKRLVGFYRRGQLSVEAIDGLPLPLWLTGAITQSEIEEVVAGPLEEESESKKILPVTPVDDADVPVDAIDDSNTPSPVVAMFEGVEIPSAETMSVEDLKEWAGNQTAVGALHKVLDAEAEGKARKTALKALRDRIEELTNEAS